MNRVYHTLPQLFDGEQLAFAVHGNQIGQLVPLAEEIGLQQFLELPHIDDLSVEAGILAQVAGGGGGDELEQDGGVGADALDLQQLFIGGMEHPGERTEMIHQPVGQRVDIPLGNGIKQQQLQHLVVGQAVEPTLQKFCLGPLAVAGMDTASSPFRHALTPFSPLLQGKYSIFAAGRQGISRSMGQNRTCGRYRTSYLQNSSIRYKMMPHTTLAEMP